MTAKIKKFGYYIFVTILCNKKLINNIARTLDGGITSDILSSAVGFRHVGLRYLAQLLSGRPGLAYCRQENVASPLTINIRKVHGNDR